MRIAIELDDAVLSAAISEHLLNKDVIRDAVGKAMNKSEFVGMFSAWLSKEMVPSLQEALGTGIVQEAIISSIAAVTRELTGLVAKDIKAIKSDIDNFRQEKAAATTRPLHPAIAKRIR